MAEAKGKFEPGSCRELPAAQVTGHIWLIAEALAVKIQEQAPLGGLPVGGGFELKTRGTFVADEFPQRKIPHLLPRFYQFGAGFHSDKLALLIFGKAVIKIVFAHDVGVDDVVGLLDIDKRCVERF